MLVTSFERMVLRLRPDTLLASSVALRLATLHFRRDFDRAISNLIK